MEIKKIIEQLRIGTSTLLPEVDLYKKLKRGGRLKVKLGMDPTAADLHLGHAVVLSKMKQLQDMGHEIIFLIGDYTARIGDPTGKSKMRPPLTEAEIQRNMQTYFEQIKKFLDPDKVTVKCNSEWLDALSSKEFVSLCARVTVARLIEREDFANRIQAQQAIGFHELLYPLLQGYDSVVLEADIELGGTDQTFNLLMGRYLQEQYGQEPQIIITTPLLEGLDGVQKMSKSLGNAIGLIEPAGQAFGKLMSINDDLMWRYFELLLYKDHSWMTQAKSRVAGGTLHPMAAKKEMAYEIIERFWSKEEAESARKQFEALFQKKDYSQANEVSLPSNVKNPCWIIDLLKVLDAVKSSSEAKRLIESGAVIIDDKSMKDFRKEIKWKAGMIIKVGKHRIYKIS
ncbi:tyrosine--tRNA ligase [Candidatus Dependentiae bacterium]|nr:tyrosine--tRNA ligase [Candidatus Dependentiae bacterium]